MTTSSTAGGESSRLAHRARWRMVLVGILAMPVIVSCSPATTGPTPTVAASTVGATTGHVVGFVTSRSGINPTPRPVHARVTAVETGVDASQALSIETAGDGSFTFDLPPGAYALAAILPGSGSETQTAPKEITVIVGAASRVEFDFIAP